MIRTEDSNSVKIVAVIAITIIESIALVCGIDGALLALSFAFIGGLGGYELRKSLTSE